MYLVFLAERLNDPLLALTETSLVLRHLIADRVEVLPLSLLAHLTFGWGTTG